MALNSDNKNYFGQRLNKIFSSSPKNVLDLFLSSFNLNKNQVKQPIQKPIQKEVQQPQLQNTTSNTISNVSTGIDNVVRNNNLTPQIVSNNLSSKNQTSINLQDAQNKINEIKSKLADITAKVQNLNNAQILPGNKEQTNALPEVKTYKDLGYSASFDDTFSKFSNLLSQAQEINKSIQDYLGTPEQSIADIERNREINRQFIESSYQRAFNTAELNRQMLERALNIAGEKLEMTPARIRPLVEEYSDKAKYYINQIDNNIAELTKEYNLALQNNDINAANQIRAEKLNWINIKRQLLSDNINLYTTALNSMITAQSFKQKEAEIEQNQAANIINYALKAFSGKRFEEIPQDSAIKILDAFATLGIPESMAKNILSGKSEISHAIPRGDYIYFFDSNYNYISKMYAPTASSLSLSSPQKIINAYINGDISRIPSSAIGAWNDKLEELRKDFVGNEIWAGRQSILNKLHTKNSSGYALYTVDDAMRDRDNLASSIAEKIYRDPNAVSIYLGNNYVAGTQEAKEALEKLISPKVDEWIPVSFIYNEAARAKSPTFGDTYFDNSEINKDNED